MSESYLVFKIGNKEFASELIKIPIILIARKYIGLSSFSDITNLKLPFEGTKINLIDIGKLIGIEQSKMTINSRLIVGQLEDNFFGFLADEVIEITYLDKEDLTENKNYFSEFVHSYFKTENKILYYLDIDRLIKFEFSEIFDSSNENNE